MRPYIFTLLLLISIVFFSCEMAGYGKRIKVSELTEVYIKNDATEDEANKLGKYIDSTWKDQTNKKSFQLSKDSGKYTVRMVVDENKVKNDTTLDVSFQAVQFLIENQVFSGRTVTLILTDDKFKDVKTIKSSPSLFNNVDVITSDYTKTVN